MVFHEMNNLVTNLFKLIESRAAYGLHCVSSDRVLTDRACGSEQDDFVLVDGQFSL